MNTVPSFPQTPFKRNWFRCFSLVLAAFLGGTALAQSTGSISGVVSDKATSGFLVGAEVHLFGTDVATATNRDGTFSLSNVPAGNQTLAISYVGRRTKTVPVSVQSGGNTTANVDLGDADVIVMEKITVESVREGQSRAINQQRTSNTVISSSKACPANRARRSSWRSTET
ncbi:MAG: carboxypeptidase-like regulatory domain-containing protein [Opitutus sp.]|nr:carboxypeptidase-like regulatory domain-containing protein [Opitutus sp.]